MAKIIECEVLLLRAPDGEERPHWVSHFIVPSAREIMVRLRTDDGVEGFGLATNYANAQPVLDVLKGGLAEQVTGMDPTAPERIQQHIIGLTSHRTAYEKGWSRDGVVRASAAIDIACWDIIGKMAGMPLYRLFGGFRDKVPVYVTCAYYRKGKDNAELRDEMQMLAAQGHKGFKAKVGGLPLDEDIARMEIVREEIGPDKQLMIDVNRAWDLKTAIEGARALEPLDITWLEEPVRWLDDRRELKILASKTSIPLSGGESEYTSFGCRSLLEEQAVDILQFDCTMFGGFTEGRKLAALCELNHVDVAPHHDCNIHAHLVAASPAGRIVESFTDPERDPLQAELFENPHRIADGWLTLNDAPGLGLTLSEAAVEKFGERVV